MHYAYKNSVRARVCVFVNVYLLALVSHLYGLMTWLHSFYFLRSHLLSVLLLTRSTDPFVFNICS